MYCTENIPCFHNRDSPCPSQYLFDNVTESSNRLHHLLPAQHSVSHTYTLPKWQTKRYEFNSKAIPFEIPNLLILPHPFSIFPCHSKCYSPSISRTPSQILKYLNIVKLIHIYMGTITRRKILSFRMPT